MKTSFVVFVVVLAFVVLDFSEAFPSALPQNAPGKTPKGNPQNTFGNPPKGNPQNTFGNPPKGNPQNTFGNPPKGNPPKGNPPKGNPPKGNPPKGKGGDNNPPDNFCKGQTLMNGLQAKGGQVVCSNTQMGTVPSVNKMVSALITFPKNNANIPQNKPFNVNVKVSNLKTGFFSDPNDEYYLFPQQLDAEGLIQGHSHVTVQQLFGENVPDATKTVFFKGLNDPAVNGVLSVTVDTGLPDKGIYRICTMNSANTHQPVIMPVAQRGSQDDCIRVNAV